jgi:hypothetical protein
MWCATMAGTAIATSGNRKQSCCTTDEIETDATGQLACDPGAPEFELIKVASAPSQG